jgi:hypothetical protein
MVKRLYLGDAALARLPLYQESADGKLTPVGPLQSIGVLFDDHGGELSEAAVTTIANGYDDPNTMVAALNKLGAIKVRKESGEVVFRLDEEGGARTGNGDSVSSTSGPGRVSTADGTASMAIGFSSGSALDNYEETGEPRRHDDLARSGSARRPLRGGEDPQGWQRHADGRQVRGGQGDCQCPARRWHRRWQAHCRQAQRGHRPAVHGGQSSGEGSPAGPRDASDPQG